jgi:hypothetical protein
MGCWKGGKFLGVQNVAQKQPKVPGKEQNLEDLVYCVWRVPVLVQVSIFSGPGHADDTLFHRKMFAGDS